MWTNISCLLTLSYSCYLSRPSASLRTPISGFGTNGGRGRCFPFFQEFSKCYVQADSPKECLLKYEDYQECLYHRKEVRCFETHSLFGYSLMFCPSS
ncbi:hypothetical protein HDU97_005534 [Phlyctochytrium planicorne]|nr:hypothetical protein HDU97_005534 [Phlyctochytrium planicorne]